MIRPAWFLGISAILVALVSYLSGMVPDTNPFATSASTRSVHIDRLGGQALAGLKRDHARRHGRYDIGVFGNSRSLNVSMTDVGIDSCSFFNFSLGSESLRSSVAFLELLAAEGTAPRIALVSVDHFELQQYNNPLFLLAGDRWRLLMRDLWTGVWRMDVFLKDLARMAWRHAIIESMLFKQSFEIEFVINGAKEALGISNKISDPQPGDTFYRADGSRSPKSTAPERHPRDLLTPGSPQILFGYLRYDLERLRRLQDRGVHVILFESLLEPKSARFFADNPSPYAAAARAAFMAVCRDLSLSCHAAPGSVPFDHLPWGDYSHPPAKSTGVHLVRLLADDVRRCKRDI